MSAGTEFFRAVLASCLKGRARGDLTDHEHAVLEAASHVDRLRSEVARDAADLAARYSRLSLEVEDPTRTSFDNPAVYSHHRGTDVKLAEMAARREALDVLVRVAFGTEGLKALGEALVAQKGKGP